MSESRQGSSSPLASRAAAGASPAGRAAKAPGLPSARTVALVQRSWASVMPISDAAATLFYDRLFEMDPSVRPLFKNDMREQKKKLMQTLAVAVDGLSNPPKLIPVLQQLGARHAGYMVVDRHYDLVGAALLWTLREGLGDAFTPEVEAAWTEVYGLIADVMKKAAAAQGAQKTPDPVSPLAQLSLGAPKEAARATPRVAQPRAIVVPAPKVVPDLAIATPPDSTPLAGRTLQGFTFPSGGEGAVNIEIRTGPATPVVPARPAPAAPAAPAASSGLPSARTVELVQRSWASVMPISDAAATLFYDRLFEMDPSVRPLFKNDMREQKKKLMQTLAVAVDGLSNPPKLIPVLQQLGVRHAGYMVVDRHYDLVGEALLWTLREGLGDAFTSEVEAAWTEVYGLIADVMKKAAAEHAPKLPAAVPAGRSAHRDSDAPTLQIDSSRGDEAALLYGRLQSDLAPPPLAAEKAGPTMPPPVEISSRQAVSPAPAADAGRALLVPLAAGQDGTLKIHLKLDAGAPLAAAPQVIVQPAAAGSAQGGLAPGLLLGLLCMVASMAGAAAVVLNVARLGQAVTHPALVLGAPLSALVLALAAFALGFLWGRGRAPSGGEAKR